VCNQGSINIAADTDWKLKVIVKKFINHWWIDGIGINSFKIGWIGYFGILCLYHLASFGHTLIAGHTWQSSAHV
jgi:hypothetical protein